MKTLKVKELKKLARIIHQTKVQGIDLQDIVFGDGRTLDMVYKELLKLGIEVK